MGRSAGSSLFHGGLSEFRQIYIEIQILVGKVMTQRNSAQSFPMGRSAGSSLFHGGLSEFRQIYLQIQVIVKNSGETLFIKTFQLANDSPKLSYIEFTLKLKRLDFL
ncbi:hypothetical protein [Leptospira borgpetersenii]|nr:hypothetical protein [Leptospira borgpetersenii serovar Balcanica]